MRNSTKIWPALLLLLSASAASSTASTTKTHQNHLRRKAEVAEPRIIGGTLVRDVFPYFGLWEVGCGVALIHDDLLLTAAHCDISNIFARRVYLGSLRAGEGVARNAIDLEKHPQYSEYTNTHDIMVVKLNASALVDAPALGVAHTAEGSSDNGEVQNITASISKSKSKAAVEMAPTGLKPVTLNRDINYPPAGTPLTIMGYVYCLLFCFCGLFTIVRFDLVCF